MSDLRLKTKICLSSIIFLLTVSFQAPSLSIWRPSSLSNATSNNTDIENDDFYPVSRLLSTGNSIQNLKVINWDKFLSSVLNIRISNSSRQCDIDLEGGCNCKHLVALSKGESTKQDRWQRHHQSLVQTSQSFTGDLDVLFLGDSIIEQWNGTRWLGKRLFIDSRKSFQNTFSKAHGAQLEGLALGAAGDNVQNLNWHVQNGFLPERVSPRVIWILIGTNNFGQHCSTPENVASGVLEVVHQSHLRKPNATIVVQGLLPRSDSIGNFLLGDSWNQIQRTNDLLKSISRLIPFLHYYEFPSDKLLISKQEMSNQFLRDGVHPSAAGYDLIGKDIEAEILNLLS